MENDYECVVVADFELEKLEKLTITAVLPEMFHHPCHAYELRNAGKTHVAWQSFQDHNAV